MAGPTRQETLHARAARLVPWLALALAVPGCGGGEERSDGAGSAGSARSKSSWLRDATDELGLDFVHSAGATDDFLLPRIMGGGLALFDCDGDGDLDLYFVNGADSLDGAGPQTNRLYVLEDGRYRDATVGSGLDDPSYGMGVAVGDVDNDGDLDVYVTNSGPDRLFLNRGDGTFEDATAAWGLDVPGWSCSAAMFDYDRDGWLDVYVTQYVVVDREKECHDKRGRRDYCSPKAYQAARDVLLHNEGGRGFRDVSESSGVRAPLAAGLGVVADDFDLDGWPDVYVTNDGYANFLWGNAADGSFQEQAILYGAALNRDGAAEAGMGIVSADLDGDLDSDLFMTHLKNESNTLYRNLGPGRGFQDATTMAGMSATSMPWTGFGTLAFDLELDGDVDIAVVNGRVEYGEPLAGARLPEPWKNYCEPNLFFENDGAGRFTLFGDEVAGFTAPIEVSRGLVAGDLDGDGDLDLVTTNLESRARIYRNEAPRRGSWLAVRALDPALRRDALGARVTVACGEKSLVRTVRTTDSYLSSSAPVVHFGLGACGSYESLVVDWPDGLRERFPGGAADRSLVVRRGDGEPLE